MSSIKQNWRVAVLDMYEGVPNEGMRCIREILAHYAAVRGLQLTFDEYEVRLRQEVPDLSYDIYISTGGPGSPVASAGSDWERVYFDLIHQLLDWNKTAGVKKHMLFICHSYQLMCRYFELGNVCQRRSPAFGVFPVHITDQAVDEPVLAQLRDPFYIVDSRNWQVISLNQERLDDMGARVLAIEKERPHVPLERATMAIRFNDEFIGTQFHPEADATGMRMYLLQEEKKQQVINSHGAAKYYSILEQLTDPDKIMLTHDKFIPAFLDQAVYSGVRQHIPA